MRAKLEKMRQRKQADGSSAPRTANSFRTPPTCQEEAEYRKFNKRFYDEFRKKNRGPKPRPPTTQPPPQREQQQRPPADAHSQGDGAP
eukprot:CAMPEP_0118988768 /NCGR_PEP_ID=MMETSP1173-20130426/46812_1 /TAXON_ID=1034831 /ORGANISM="Rhizochromulina marina cf, Strain CCMP1243" /LENGTH=87 /DNA_ID=CAMNT_0006939717 /DNA_START=6 /DNA_END=265 /DNA_ORIENTATION=-